MERRANLPAKIPKRITETEYEVILEALREMEAAEAKLFSADPD
ncbi:MAG TPA: hypothetical protein VFS12_08490 [Terriglobia bacterium]|nr:hypothetical protein [Terriglobia bacterium]